LTLNQKITDYHHHHHYHDYKHKIYTKHTMSFSNLGSGGCFSWNSMLSSTSPVKVYDWIQSNNETKIEKKRKEKERKEKKRKEKKRKGKKRKGKKRKEKKRKGKKRKKKRKEKKRKERKKKRARCAFSWIRALLFPFSTLNRQPLLTPNTFIITN